MNGRVIRVTLVQLEPAQILQRAVQLRVQILPLAHPQIGKEIRLAEFSPLALRAEALPLVVNRVPDFQQREKIRLRISKALVRGGGGVLFVERTFARVLNAQAGGDDEQFARGVFVLRLQQHPAQRRVNWQPREIVAELREFARVVERAEFLQEQVAALNCRRWRRIDERKRLNVTEPIRLHAQNNFGQIRALDFRLRVLRGLQKIFLGIQPDAHAVLHAPGAAFALVGAALRNRFNRQPLGARAWIVTADAGEAGVNDVTDAGNGQRCFRDIRGDYDFPSVQRGKNTLLIRRAQQPEQRDDFRLAPEPALQQIARLADVAFAGHEDENVAVARFTQSRLRRAHGGVNVSDVAALLGVRVERRVNHFHWKQPPGDFDDWRVVEGAGKCRGVNRRRGDDEFEIAPLDEQRLQVTKQKINVQAAFVRLVNDDAVVFRKQRVALRLGQQNAVGHQLDVSLRAAAVIKTDGAADFAAPVDIQFLRNASRNGQRRHATRLRATNFCLDAQPRFQAHLGNLRRLP